MRRKFTLEIIEQNASATMTSINTTEESAIVPDETACATSLRNKTLFSALDKTLNNVEQQLQQNLTRYLVKPLRCRLKKRDYEPIAEMANKVVEEWRRDTQDGIRELIFENNISQQLCKLDELAIQEKKRHGTNIGSGNSREAWRPTGRPATEMEPSMVIRKLEYRDRLKETVEKLERDEAANRREVERGRDSVIAADKEISKVGRQLEQKLEFIMNKVDENGRSIMSNEELAEMRDQIKKTLGKLVGDWF